MKITKRKSVKKKINSEKSIMLYVAVVTALLFLLVPIMGRISILYNIMQFVVQPLASYKSSYFEAVGAMIGSFLAVTGAIWVQKRAEDNQEKYRIRKSAVIVYYDIKMFYQKNDILASRINSELKKQGSSFYDDSEVVQNFKKLKGYSGIHIDENWIEVVAELVDVLELGQIKCIYNVYGVMSNLKTMLERDGDYSTEDIQLINKYFYDIGEKRNFYREKKEVLDVQKKLETIIHDC